MKGLALLLPALTLSFAANAKQFIIRGENLDVIDSVVLKKGGSLEHKLKYHKASIVQLTDRAAKELAKEFPHFKIEEDIEVKLISKVAIKASRRAPSQPSQPAQSTPWGIGRIGAIEAQNYARGTGIKVCVVDTGIQKDHPDLMGNIVGGENFVVSKRRVVSSEWGDDNNHGTHVSGTIAALNNNIGVIGVAPESKLFGVKVLDSNGSGYTSAVADGIRSCVTNNARIISMSLGSSAPSDILQDAITIAKAAGVIIVAAAGNESSVISYPAAYPGVVAVTATDSNDQFAYFSNSGPEVAFAAPGVNVLSTIKGSSYDSFSGTSMATPHVAGVYALMLSANKTSVKADDISLDITQQGAGLVNALDTVTE